MSYCQQFNHMSRLYVCIPRKATVHSLFDAYILNCDASVIKPCWATNCLENQHSTVHVAMTRSGNLLRVEKTEGTGTISTLTCLDQSHRTNFRPKMFSVLLPVLALEESLHRSCRIASLRRSLDGWHVLPNGTVTMCWPFYRAAPITHKGMVIWARHSRVTRASSKEMHVGMGWTHPNSFLSFERTDAMVSESTQQRANGFFRQTLTHGCYSKFHVMKTTMRQQERGYRTWIHQAMYEAMGLTRSGVRKNWWRLAVS